MKDKVIIITGGSSGIGKALAEKFGREGAKLIITGRRKELLEDAAAELQLYGIEVSHVVADASIEADCANVVDTAIRKYGKIDVLINNAGISMRARFEDIRLEVFKKVMDVNFYG